MRDCQIYALDARRGSLEVTVIKGQHDRAPGDRIEDAGKTVLHAPIQGVGTFQEEWLVPGRGIEAKILAFLDIVKISHCAASILLNSC